MSERIRTAAGGHSPPKAKERLAGKIRSCVGFCAKPQRKVKNANQAMVICSVRTRPKRSDSAPANQPPKAEAKSVDVPINPACALVIANVAMIAGIAKL